jgi:negative regulator of flagellin synthesis FlgM
MTIDINNLNPNNIPDRRVKGSASSDTSATPDKSSSAARSADDQVKLSDQAQTLKRMEDSVAELPAFDDARVKSIRDAIADGRYHVDPDRLAERFLALENELNQ